LNEQSKKELRSFFDNRLPMEVNQAFASYDDITRVAWNTVNNTGRENQNPGIAPNQRDKRF
jgi:hypothetical protein